MQFPGGHLEANEEFAECAARETLEETGLEVKDVKFVTATNDVFEAEKKHYITIFMCCRRADEQKQPEVSLPCQPVVVWSLGRGICTLTWLCVLQIKEPEKCESWTWRSEAELREFMATEDSRKRLFLPIVNLFRLDRFKEQGSLTDFLKDSDRSASSS